MQLPRLKSGPLCYTLREWAYRTSIYQTFLFLFLAVLFFFLASQMEDDQAAAKGLLIAIGVIFCFPAVFGIVLFVGLAKDNTTLLNVWIIFSLVGVVVFTLLLIGVAILSFVNGQVGNGFILLAVAVVIVGQMIYNTFVVNTIRWEIIEKETTPKAEVPPE